MSSKSNDGEEKGVKGVQTVLMAWLAKAVLASEPVVKQWSQPGRVVSALSSATVMAGFLGEGMAREGVRRRADVKRRMESAKMGGSLVWDSEVVREGDGWVLTVNG